MTEIFPIAGVVKQGIEYIKAQQIQAASTSSDTASPDYVANSVSDDLTPPYTINDIFGSIVNNVVDGQVSTTELDQFSEDLFDSIVSSAPEDPSQFNFM